MSLRFAGFIPLKSTVPVGTASPLAPPRLSVLLEDVDDDGRDEDDDDDDDDDRLDEDVKVEDDLRDDEDCVSEDCVSEDCAWEAVDEALDEVPDEVPDAGVGPGSSPPPSMNSHSPVNTPTSGLAKKVNRLSERSRAPSGQPGHMSTIIASAVFPLKWIRTILKH